MRDVAEDQCLTCHESVEALFDDLNADDAP